jgi:hypothetical protein
LYGPGIDAAGIAISPAYSPMYPQTGDYRVEVIDGSGAVTFMTTKYFDIGTTMVFDSSAKLTVTAMSTDTKIELYRNGVKKADIPIPASGTSVSVQIGETGEYHAVRTLANDSTFRTNSAIVHAVVQLGSDSTLKFDDKATLTLENIPAGASKVELYRDGSLWSTKTESISSPLAMNTYASGSYNARILDASDRLLAETTSVDATLSFDIEYSSGSFTVTFPPMDYTRVELLSEPSGKVLVTANNTVKTTSLTFTGSVATEGDYILRFVKDTTNYDHNVDLAVMFNTLALTRLGGNSYKYVIGELSVELEDGSFVDHASHPSGSGVTFLVNPLGVKYYESNGEPRSTDEDWVKLFDNVALIGEPYSIYLVHAPVGNDTVMCVLKFDKKIRKPVSGKIYMEISGGEGVLKIHYGDIDHDSSNSTFFNIGNYSGKIILDRPNSLTYSARYVTDEHTITLDRKDRKDRLDDDEGNVEGNIEY